MAPTSATHAPPPWRTLVHLIQLTRVALVLTAVSNSWLVVFLAWGGAEPTPIAVLAGGWPLGLVLLLAAAVAAGLHTYGIALNDVLDVRHDRLFSPDRPIAAGRLAAGSGIIVALVALLLALAAAMVLGPASGLLAVLAAAGILFYDLTGKYFPAVGIVLLGLIRVLNMLIPHPTLGFAWPLWLTMTHVIACSAIAYAVSAKRPRLAISDWWWLCAGWAFWTLALVSSMGWRGMLVLHGRPLAWLGPALAVALFIVLASWQLRRARRPRLPRRTRGAAFMTHALLWLIVYDAAWLFAVGMWWPGTLHMLVFVAAHAMNYLLRFAPRSPSAASYRASPMPLP